MRTTIGFDAGGVDEAGDGEAIFRFAVGDTVAAGNDGTSFGDFFGTTAQDFAQNVAVEVVGEGDEVDGEEGTAAHCIHIGEGVGGGNRAEVVGVVYDGREEVGGGDEGLLVIEAVDGGVIGRSQSYQQVGEVLRPEKIA